MEVKCKVTYNPKEMVVIGKMMSKMDLGISEVQEPREEYWSWKTSEKIDDRYVVKMKQGVQEAVESRGDKFINVDFY